MEHGRLEFPTWASGCCWIAHHSFLSTWNLVTGYIKPLTHSAVGAWPVDLILCSMLPRWLWGVMGMMEPSTWPGAGWHLPSILGYLTIPDIHSVSFSVTLLERYSAVPCDELHTVHSLAHGGLWVELPTFCIRSWVQYMSPDFSFIHFSALAFQTCYCHPFMEHMGFHCLGRQA